jgi:hypothetical protein
MTHQFKPDNVKLAEAEQKAAREKYIPKISQQEVARLLRSIRPLVRIDDTLYEFKLRGNAFSSGFTWERNSSVGAAVDSQKLKLLVNLETYHECEYHHPFHPTIAEVLAQIPAELKDTVTAFEVLDDDATEFLSAPGFSGYKTWTKLYGAA